MKFLKINLKFWMITIMIQMIFVGKNWLVREFPGVNVQMFFIIFVVVSCEIGIIYSCFFRKK